LEHVVRNSTALFVLIATLAVGGSALARDITLHKTSAEELKTTCDKAGGRFSQGPKRYGCGTNCHGGPGTDCIVSCGPDEQCVAQVIGGRRPRSVAAALTKPGRH
jgi:hypothetical protein